MQFETIDYELLEFIDSEIEQLVSIIEDEGTLAKTPVVPVISALKRIKAHVSGEKYLDDGD